MVPKPNMRGIPESMVCEILMFLWSFGALYMKPASSDLREAPEPVGRNDEALLPQKKGLSPI